MIEHAAFEEIEALALGELSPARAAGIEAHAAQCAECGRELAWARAERQLLQRRPALPAAHLWAKVAERLGEHGPAPRIHRPHWARRILVGAAGAVAAAAVLLLALRPMRTPSLVSAPDAGVAEAEAEAAAARPDPKTLAALDRAESDYRDAAKVLEAEYARIRTRLDPALAKRWDETLTRARTQLGSASTAVAEDVNGRMRVLDGYAGYLRSLRNVVQESEEANP